MLNHHNDEGEEGDGNCLAQQWNGLWYDSGPGTKEMQNIAPVWIARPALR